LFSFFGHIEVSQNTTPPPIMLLVPLKKSINWDAPSFWTHGAKAIESKFYYQKFNEIKTKQN
jgi:hypothetical protein